MYYWIGNNPCGCSSPGLSGMGLTLSTLPTSYEDVGTTALTTAAAMDPEPYSKMALTVAAEFAKGWEKIEEFLHIGEGRRDANIITPVQNSVANRLAEIVRAYPTATIIGLQSFLNELFAMKQEFIAFIQDDRLIGDGDTRASDQAYNDIIPLIDDNISKITNRIYQLGGRPYTPTVTQGYGSAIPSLRTPSGEYPAIPQSGTIWPNAPLSPLRPTQAGMVSPLEGSTLPLLLVGGMALFFLSRR